MDIDAQLPRGTASDSLTTQIHIGNVLQTHAILERQANAIQDALHKASDLRRIPRCGDDPVSRDAQHAFQDKINRILHAQDVHLAELHEAAVQYDLVEDETAGSFR